MLSRIYIALLCASAAIAGFFTFYSWSWLGSIGSPATAVAGHEYHAGIAWTVLWVTAIILLFMAKSILWRTGRIWPMWATLIYFAVFVVAKAFWLDPAKMRFQNEAGLTDSTFTLAPILGALLIIVATSIVFFEQFVIIRLKQKTYPEEIAAGSDKRSGSKTAEEKSPGRLEDRDSDNGRDGEI